DFHVTGVQTCALPILTDADDLMIINRSGLAIRMSVENLRVMGRATQGVKLINLKGNDAIAAVAKVMQTEEGNIALDNAITPGNRSEERRVGKECRYRR